MVPIDELEEYPRKPRAWRWVAAVVAAALAIALISYGLIQPAPEGASTGDSAPEFELPLLGEEGTITSDELKGKTVVLNFWASYCISCKEEAPVLDNAWREYRDRDVVVLGVDSSRDSDSAALAFADAFGMTYPLAKDDGSLAKALDINDRFLPQTIYIDADWELTSIYQGDVLTDGTNNVVLGPVTEKGLREQIESMLADS